MFLMDFLKGEFGDAIGVLLLCWDLDRLYGDSGVVLAEYLLLLRWLLDWVVGIWGVWLLEDEGWEILSKKSSK